MKIKKFKSKQILKLHLLKSKIYEQTVKKNNFLVEPNLTQTVANFKKALQVIFQYHNAKKKILFIGIPKKLEFKVNRLTKHVAVPSSFNFQRIFSSYLKDYDIKNNFSSSTSNYFLPKLSNKPALIVLFSHDKTDNIALESYSTKIPLIVFNANSLDSNLNNFYRVQGNGNNLTNLDNQNIFYLGLNFLFKIHRKNPNISRDNSSKFFKPNNSKRVKTYKR